MLRFFKIFSFAGRDSQMTFARYAVAFAALLGGLWLLGRLGVLPGSFARDQELLTLGLVIIAVPVVATMLRRLNDTVFPGGLLVAAPAVLGLSYFLPVVAGIGWAGPILFWASIAGFAAMAVGLCWPSKPTVEQGVQVTGGSHAH